MACASLTMACSPADDGPSELLPAPGSLLDAPTEPLPPTLSEVGLYPDPADRSRVPDRAIAYSPRWPLWSGGSDKERFVVLPPGTTIDNRERDAWQYPDGTLFFKTFAYDGLPVETRVLRKQAMDDWELAAYQWNAEGTDAALLDGDFEVVVPLGADRQHTIPSTLMCRECHESSPHPVLGDAELQLSESPTADGASALSLLDARGVLRVPPPAKPRMLSDHAEDAQTQAVLGWFVADCLHCHNGSDGPSSSFDLDPAVALANTIGQSTESSASAAGIRIVAGSPSQSILFLAISGEHDDPEIEPMPPVIVDAQDQRAIENLRTFIAGLPVQ